MKMTAPVDTIATGQLGSGREQPASTRIPSRDCRRRIALVGHSCPGPQRVKSGASRPWKSRLGRREPTRPDRIEDAKPTQPGRFAQLVHRRKWNGTVVMMIPS
jgi:hypothetical protein